MRILQIHTAYRQQGGEDVIADIEASLLRDSGHEVLQHHAANSQHALQTLAGLTLAPWNPVTARAVRRVAREFKPDVAHVHNTWFQLSPSVLTAIHSLGVPVVMTLHNYRLLCANAMLLRDGKVCEDCVGTHPWRGVQHRCYRGSTALSVIAASTISMGRARHVWDSSVDSFIAPSAFLAEKLAAGGVTRRRIVVKPHGVADPGKRERRPSDSSTVLFVGRLSPEKGISVLIKAWANARPSGLELVVVGDGPQRALLEGFGTPGVRFLGWRERHEVQRLMLSARALAFPSIWYEGLPSTLLEAFAAGLPVLASDIGGAAEIARMLGRQWVVASGNVSAWEASVAGLASSIAVDAAGSRGRQLYDSHFTLELSRSRLLEIYAGAIDASAHESREVSHDGD